MAEFLTHNPPPSDYDGFANMGKPVPEFRKAAAYRHAKDIGLDAGPAFTLVSGMAEQLARDKPYEAMQRGMQQLDLTGTYRIMAVLLTEPEPEPTAAEGWREWQEACSHAGC